MEENQRYSPSYRAIETRQVIEWIKAGQSGHIIGLKGSGKSNFVRFLLQGQTQLQYLGQDQANYILILVNLLELSERSEWGIYELLINSLLTELQLRTTEDDTVSKIKNLHQDILHTPNAQLAQRLANNCLSVLCQQSTRRLVFLFDEFDAVFRDLPAATFRGLRAIRDAHKEQISFIVIGTRDLADLRNDLTDEVEHFYRLVSRNVCGVGPYRQDDARQMIHYLASKLNLQLSEKNNARLIEMSGGHAGMLKTTINLYESGNFTNSLTVPIQEPAIKRECQKIWENLSGDEQTALSSFLSGYPLNAQMLQWLKLRGLIFQGGKNALTLFSPLFETFVRTQLTPTPKGTFISRSPQIVQIEGRRVTTLSESEFELLFYLYEQNGRVSTKSDIIENVYRQRYEFRDSGMTDAMLQQLISRLRKKIDLEKNRLSYVITVHGEGYKFAIPPET